MEDIRNDIGFDKLNFDIVYDRVECGLKIHVPDPFWYKAEKEDDKKYIMKY